MQNRTLRTAFFGALSGLVILSASGCQTVREDWASVPERRAPQANLVQHLHPVTFAADSARLEQRERDKLDGFLAHLAVGDRDTVFLVPNTVDDSLGERRNQTVAAFLIHRGVIPQSPVEEVSVAEPRTDVVSVVVRRYAVTLPGCPDWDGGPEDNWNNMTTPNWGCATATNLGLMIADPGDLVVGRDPGPMDGNTASAAIRRYRDGKTKPIITESSTGGGSQ